MNNTFEYKNKKGETWYLHTKTVTLTGGRRQKIYFFARNLRDGDTKVEYMPAGFMVFESTRSGMPMLKRV